MIIILINFQEHFLGVALNTQFRGLLGRSWDSSSLRAAGCSWLGLPSVGGLMDGLLGGAPEARVCVPETLEAI